MSVWDQNFDARQPLQDNYSRAAVEWCFELWTYAVGFWLYGAGMLAHLFEEAFRLMRLSQVCATVMGQILSIVICVYSTNAVIGWVTTSISAPFRAVVSYLPPSDFELYTMSISISLSLPSLIWNLTNVIFLGVSLAILAVFYVTLHIISHPCVCLMSERYLPDSCAQEARLLC